MTKRRAGQNQNESNEPQVFMKSYGSSIQKTFKDGEEESSKEQNWKLDYDNENEKANIKIKKNIDGKKSKEEKILPMGFTDNLKLKKDIKKDELISLNDVDLNLEKEIIEAREYQNNLIS